MAIAVNDVLQINDVQSYLGQLCLNVYFYRVDVAGSALTYQDVADYFQTQIVTEVVEIQNVNLVHTSTVIRNVTNGLDIFEDPLAITGGTSLEGAPSFTAASFRLLRATALTRHGAKRIAGIPEVYSLGNDLNPTYSTQIAAVALALGNPVEVDSAGDLDLTMTPVIVGRYPVGGPNAGQLDLSKVNDVAAAQFIRISTQTTRRAGRGA